MQTHSISLGQRIVAMVCTIAMLFVLFPQAATPAFAITEELTVTVTDSESHPIEGVTITMTPAEETLSTLTGSTDVDGVATFSITADGSVSDLKADETYKLSASKTGYADYSKDDVTAAAGNQAVTLTATVPVTKVEVNLASSSINIGATTTASATVSPEDADDDSVTWSSDKKGIATVDEDGTVTGVSKGTATITATANDGSGKTGSAEITVLQPVTGITVEPSTAELVLGATPANDTTTLTASVEPANADEKGYTWSSSADTIATVDSTGKVTAKAVGTATITATAKDGSGKTGSCTITVKQMVKIARIMAGTPAERDYNGSTAIDRSNFTVTLNPATVTIIGGDTYSVHNKIGEDQSVTPNFEHAELSSDLYILDTTLPDELDLRFDILPKTVFLASVSVSDIVYNAKTDVPKDNVSLTLTGVETADEDAYKAALKTAMTLTRSSSAVGNDVTVNIDHGIPTGSVASCYLLDTNGIDSTKVKVTPKTLTVALKADREITKASDGTNALPTGVDETYFELSGVETTDAANVALTLGGITAWKYHSIMPADGIAIDGVAATDFGLSGTAAGNYAISATAPTVTGNITPHVPTDTTLDTTDGTHSFTMATDVTITTTVGGEAADDTYWYGLANNSLLPDAPDYAFTQENGSPLDAPLTMEEGANKTFSNVYVTKDNIVYGPMSITYNYDATAPTIGTVAVQKANHTAGEIDFDKDNVVYTIVVADEEGGSGLNVAALRYCVLDTQGATPADTDWITPTARDVEATDTGVRLSITTPASGYLYIQAGDCAQNSATQGIARALVIESIVPTIDTLVVENEATGEQEHSVSFTAHDDGTYVSGVRKINYKLYKDGEEAPADWTELIAQDADPDTLEAITAADSVYQEWAIEYDDIKDILAQTDLDGDYILLLQAVDYCGNVSATTTCPTLHLDNTAPTIEVEMSTPETAYYFNADNCGIEITVTDDTTLADGTYSATLATTGDAIDGTVDTTDPDKTLITFAAADVADLEDGTATLTVSATDKAGNTATEMTTTNMEYESGLTASFVLDTTAPVVTAIDTEQTAKGPYDTYNDYYYNDASVVTAFTIEDTNLTEAGESGFWEVTCASVADPVVDTATAGTVTVTMSAEGLYADLAIAGTDRAGNKLTLASTGIATVNAATATDGTITLNSAKILDRTAPVATINYTSTAAPNLYPGEEDFTAAAYYKADITANITVADSYMDGSDEIVTDVDDTKLFSALNTATAANLASAAASHSIMTDSRNTITVYGTDRAGNVLTVKENIPGTSTYAAPSTGHGTAFTPKYQLVLDKTAPSLTGVVSSAPSGDYTDSDPSEIYYKADYTVAFSVTELNYDKARATVNAGSDAEPSLVSSALTDEDATTDPTITLTVTTQDDIPREENTPYLTLTDKAGNKLVLDAAYTNGGHDYDAFTVTDGKAISATTRVVDTMAPTVELSYAFKANDALLDATHYYVDGTTKTSYYNDTFTAKYVFEDKGGLDPEKLYTARSTPEEAAPDFTELSEVEEDSQSAAVTYTVSNAADGGDTISVFSVQGTDKAGNKLNVTEKQTTGPDKTTTKKGVRTYTSVYQKALDTVNPLVDLILTTSADNRDMRHGDGNNRYYFNKKFNAAFTVTELNFDAAKVAATYGFDGESDRYDTDTVDPRGTVVSAVSGSNGTYTYSADYTANGLYRFALDGKDRAGNPIVYKTPQASNVTLQNHTQPDETTGAKDKIGKNTSFYVAIDTVDPKIIVEFDDFHRAVLSDGNRYVVELNHPYQKRSSTTLTLTGDDCSPLSAKYDVQSTISGQNADDDTGDDYAYRNKLTAKFNAQQILYMNKLSVVDLAGNRSTLAKPGNKIYLDTTAPTNDELAPTISVKATANGEGRGPAGNPLFDSTVTVNAKVTDPGEGVNASGLYHVYYQVTVNGDDWTDRVGTASSVGGSLESPGVMRYQSSGSEYSANASSVDETITCADSIDFTFDADTFNYNDVKIFVWAEDNSGNRIEQSDAAYYYFGIDITAPKIEVSYDNNDAQNEKYFKADRTATVVVTERNFDADNTVITTESGASIGGWSYSAGALPNGDDDTWTCQVVYSVDGDYTFNVTTIDLLGHDGGDADYGASVAPQEFVIDKTLPTITIDFDNNDVRNAKYYKAYRTATIHVQEHNFSAADAKVTTTASIQEGSVAAPTVGSWGSAGDTNNANVNFNNDGNYTMHVEFTDLAGNEAEPEDVDEFVVDTTPPEIEIGGVEDQMAYNGDVAPSITYHDINYDNTSASVNITGYKHPEGSNLNGSRSDDAFGGSFTCNNIDAVKENDDVYTATGSVSDLAGNTTEDSILFSVNRFGSTYILETQTAQLVDSYYTNAAPTLQVTEINVSPLVKQEITTSLNGTITTLQKDADYTVQSSHPGWMQYDYTINAASFDKEGAYTVTLHSVDDATNSNSNRAIKENGGATNELPIEFLLDTTSPIAIINGVENNQQYIEAERDITVNYDDNTALASLVIYLNDQKVAEYDPDALTAAGGVLHYRATAQNSWQVLKVETVDVAGNVSTTDSVRYLLTSNLFVQYFNNKPLFYGSLIGLVGVGALIWFLLAKRRKDDEEETPSAAL